MYSKFRLKHISSTDFINYKQIGTQLYKRCKTTIKQKLCDCIDEDGIIDGIQLQENWFPTTGKFNIFLSHSHNDEDAAVALAGFLYQELNLTTFIDSCLWGYSNILLRSLDNKYCKKQSDKTLFDYDSRNYSTSHVHMMLSVALMNMIDECESVFFFDTPKSISLQDAISEEITGSPWIYNELSIVNKIRVCPLDTYRNKKEIFEHAASGMESLQIEYNVSGILKNFTPLTICTLQQWAKNFSLHKEKYRNSLDCLYQMIAEQNELLG